MPENYQLAISYLPMLFLAVSGTILFTMKKLTFNANILLLFIAILAKIALSIIFGGFLFFLAQFMLSLLAFIVIIMFFGKKTSGETILTMCSMFVLTPLLEGIPAFILVFVLLLIYSAFNLRKNKGEWKTTMHMAFISTGLSNSAPNYDYLPDKSEEDEAVKKEAKRITLLPFIVIVYGVSALYPILSPLWMEM